VLIALPAEVGDPLAAYHLPDLKLFRVVRGSPNLLTPLLPALDFLDAIGDGQVFRHRATEFVNGAADCQNQLVNPLNSDHFVGFNSMVEGSSVACPTFRVLRVFCGSTRVSASRR
jgi:hypothetical protein